MGIGREEHRCQSNQNERDAAAALGQTPCNPAERKQRADQSPDRVAAMDGPRLDRRRLAQEWQENNRGYRRYLVRARPLDPPQPPGERCENQPGGGEKGQPPSPYRVRIHVDKAEPVGHRPVPLGKSLQAPHHLRKVQQRDGAARREARPYGPVDAPAGNRPHQLPGGQRKHEQDRVVVNRHRRRQSAEARRQSRSPAALVGREPTPQRERAEPGQQPVRPRFERIDVRQHRQRPTHRHQPEHGRRPAPQDVIQAETHQPIAQHARQPGRDLRRQRQL